jgi:hypothetical protein
MDRFQLQVRAYALQQQLTHLCAARSTLDAHIQRAATQLSQLQPVSEVVMPDPVAPAALANPLDWAVRWQNEQAILQKNGLRLIQTTPAGPLQQLTLNGTQAEARYAQSLESWGRGTVADVLVLKDLDAQGLVTGYVTFINSILVPKQ